MTDQTDDGSLPELTPAQEADVRRLLAEARHDEPVPTEVADRLDAVLAGLTRDEPGSPGVAPVIDLAARRRRRNAAAVLAGAAAVIIAGFAIGPALVGSDTADDTAGSASVDAHRAGSDDQATQQGEDLASGGGSGVPAPSSESAPTVPGPDVRVPSSASTLRSAHLASDIRGQLDSLSYSPQSGSLDNHADVKGFSAAGCPAPTRSKFGLGDFFPALFDGTPAVLALRPPDGGQQEADVLDCTSAATLATATLPAR